MNADTDRTPVLRLTLDHYLQSTQGTWLRVVALRLDGSEVVVTCRDASASLRVPRTAVLLARQAGATEDPAEERDLEGRMAGWYAGDVHAAEEAVDEHGHDLPARELPRIAYGHPVPEFSRGPELVGVYGGDLEHIRDSLGSQDEVDARSRALRREYERGLAEAYHEDGSPPKPEADDVVLEQMASSYSGDLDAVAPHPQTPPSQD